MTWLSERLSHGRPLILPGAYDALSATLIQRAGFEACYCGGFALCAGSYGLPDLGLVGADEMAAYYRRIRESISLPMIVDADAGQGGLLNVQRTIRTFAAIGISACHIEDQVVPKRCGHLAGKAVVDTDAAVARILAAVDAKVAGSPEIIARTDAIAVHGFDNAIERANLFLAAGASVVFIDAPQNLQQVKAIPRLVNGPVLYNAAPVGELAAIRPEEICAFGYQLVIHPVELLLAASSAVNAALKKLGADFDAMSATDSELSFAAINKIINTDKFIEKELDLEFLARNY